jgi:DNA-directed RNA polymerase subunit E'
MYWRVKLEETVRIPPDRFSDDLDEVVTDIVRVTFEGTMKKNYGVIVMADDIIAEGDGRIIHGDGAMYQNVSFNALVFKPELQEVLDAVVCEVVEFGAFCHIGPLDALVHMSQIMNDYVEIDSENEVVTGREKKLKLQTQDMVRSRVVAVSLNEISARESKIGLTMRQAGLGSHNWLHEEETGDKKEKKSSSKKKKTKKTEAKK